MINKIIFDECVWNKKILDKAANSGYIVKKVPKSARDEDNVSMAYSLNVRFVTADEGFAWKYGPKISGVFIHKSLLQNDPSSAEHLLFEELKKLEKEESQAFALIPKPGYDSMWM